MWCSRIQRRLPVMSATTRLCIAEYSWKGEPERVIVPYAKYSNLRGVVFLSRAEHVKFRLNLSRLCDKTKY